MILRSERYVEELKRRENDILFKPFREHPLCDPFGKKHLPEHSFVPKESFINKQVIPKLARLQYELDSNRKITGKSEWLLDEPWGKKDFYKRLPDIEDVKQLLVDIGHIFELFDLICTTHGEFVPMWTEGPRTKVKKIQADLKAIEEVYGKLPGTGRWAARYGNFLLGLSRNGELARFLAHYYNWYLEWHMGGPTFFKYLQYYFKIVKRFRMMAWDFDSDAAGYMIDYMAVDFTKEEKAQFLAALDEVNDMQSGLQEYLTPRDKMPDLPSMPDETIKIYDEALRCFLMVSDKKELRKPETQRLLAQTEESREELEKITKPMQKIKEEILAQVDKIDDAPILKKTREEMDKVHIFEALDPERGGFTKQEMMEIMNPKLTARRTDTEMATPEEIKQLQDEMQKDENAYGVSYGEMGRRYLETLKKYDELNALLQKDNGNQVLPGIGRTSGDPVIDDDDESSGDPIQAFFEARLRESGNPDKFYPVSEMAKDQSEFHDMFEVTDIDISAIAAEQGIGPGVNATQKKSSSIPVPPGGAKTTFGELFGKLHKGWNPEVAFANEEITQEELDEFHKESEEDFQQSEDEFDFEADVEKVEDFLNEPLREMVDKIEKKEGAEPASDEEVDRYWVGDFTRALGKMRKYRALQDRRKRLADEKKKINWQKKRTRRHNDDTPKWRYDVWDKKGPRPKSRNYGARLVKALAGRRRVREKKRKEKAEKREAQKKGTDSFEDDDDDDDDFD
uniref:Uncharacterized protein n=2 Tax=Chromera velia CCMP2878 TaxID=1169474 RepID=A0A0K6S8A1_9ALVE|eukprot:Cvel_5754.t1-p1 / transcript=Cvel_5754.t1 / gene=Cvel_5754 / organism=Chromera_velia_CCMP2878 / gene_product=hypothetical protein / transcript_product=hypothetical protein / location=Cvel_scaffold273:54960-60104(+) / protein_length=736 / sequence_SO=supercontig / SO=protein_coding / is_pseudo=false